MEDNQYNSSYQTRPIPQQRMPSREPERAPRKGLRIVPMIIFVLFLFMSGVAVYEWYSMQKLKAELGIAPTEDVSKLVAEVGKLIVLPKDETPTVATVADPEALKDQPFFANAQKGDKVLIFTKAQRAILYNPATKKIVEVAPINISNNIPTTPSPSPKSSPSPKAKP
jgi:hypothetical protein